MQNKGRIPSYLTLKMYHRNAVPKEVLKDVRVLWETLIKFEVGLVLQEKTLAALHDLTKARSENQPFMADNYRSFVNGIDWLYTVSQHGKLVAFMVVGGGEVNNLFVTEDFRGRSIGTFLLHNHLEIFDTGLSLKCSKINTVAVNMYRKAGFIVTSENNVYYTMQFQFVKPADEAVEKLST